MYCSYQCKMDKPDESGDKKQIVNMNEAGGTTLFSDVKITCIDGSWNDTIQDYRCIGKCFSENKIIVHYHSIESVVISIITMIIFQSVSPYLATIIKVVSFVKQKISLLTMHVNTHALGLKSLKKRPRPLARLLQTTLVQLTNTNGNRRFKMALTINLHAQLQ